MGFNLGKILSRPGMKVGVFGTLQSTLQDELLDKPNERIEQFATVAMNRDLAENSRYEEELRNNTKTLKEMSGLLSNNPKNGLAVTQYLVNKYGLVLGRTKAEEYNKLAEYNNTTADKLLGLELTDSQVNTIDELAKSTTDLPRLSEIAPQKATGIAGAFGIDIGKAAEKRRKEFASSLGLDRGSSNVELGQINLSSYDPLVTGQQVDAANEAQRLMQAATKETDKEKRTALLIDANRYAIIARVSSRGEFSGNDQIRINKNLIDGMVQTHGIEGQYDNEFKFRPKPKSLKQLNKIKGIVSTAVDFFAENRMQLENAGESYNVLKLALEKNKMYDVRETDLGLLEIYIPEDSPDLYKNDFNSTVPDTSSADNTAGGADIDNTFEPTGDNSVAEQIKEYEQELAALISELQGTNPKPSDIDNNASVMQYRKKIQDLKSQQQ